MEFSIKSGPPEKQRGSCIVAGIFEGKALTAAARALDQASDGYLTDLLRSGDIEGKPGTSLLLHKVPGIASQRVLLVGLGKEKAFDDKAYAQAVQTAMTALQDKGIAQATLCLAALTVKKRTLAWRVRHLVMQARSCSYRFDQFKTDAPPRRDLQKLTLLLAGRSDIAPAESALRQGLAIAEGIDWARTLGNLPPNLCTPDYLADEARTLAQTHGLTCEVLDRQAMEALGMQALLAVARGSHQPPRLIVLHYRGAGADQAPVVLVGKGITFDTGGISLKPAAEMDEMKYDMCGAAGVLGTLRAVVQMQLPVNLTVIVPATENMPGGNAARPGDIVTSMSGQTIEILNTDAEGRLILCDALTYAERFSPALLIDVATLTGACVVALGQVASGLFSNNDRLARELLAASETAGDRAWQLPLWDDYQELLKSPFADMGNIGGRWGGAITAACFLSRFTKGQRWAHLDIAGTAWKSGKDKGATGRPVALLTHFLMQYAGKLA